MSARILLVEDERGIQIALRGVLRREGYQLSVVDSGAAAREALASRGFDLLLTDLSLRDGVSGLDLARDAAARDPQLPVILITAFGSDRVASEAAEAGVFDYVPKPFNNEQVREVVRRALSKPVS